MSWYSEALKVTVSCPKLARSFRRSGSFRFAARGFVA